MIFGPPFPLLFWRADPKIASLFCLAYHTMMKFSKINRVCLAGPPWAGSPGLRLLEEASDRHVKPA